MTTDVTVRLWWDDPGYPATPGWFAEYYDADGFLVADSEKYDHPVMPTNKDEENEAQKIVFAYLQRLTP